MKWNESGYRPPLCTYRLNWTRRTSWGWWDDWDDTVLQTQGSKFEHWRSEAEHATSRSRRLPTILTFTRGWGRNIFCFLQTAETGNRTPNSGVKGSGANHYPRAPAHWSVGVSYAGSSATPFGVSYVGWLATPFGVSYVGWSATPFGVSYGGWLATPFGVSYGVWLATTFGVRYGGWSVTPFGVSYGGWSITSFAVTEPRTLAWKAAVLATTLGPPPIGQLV